MNSAARDLVKILRSLRAETERTQSEPHMALGSEQGALLGLLTWFARPDFVLEIGAFTGWSTLEIAAALPPGSRFVTIDVSEEVTEIARRHAEAAGLADRVDFRAGAATAVIEELEGPFDLVFIDAAKRDYLELYEAVIPKLGERGVIVADDTLLDRDGNVAIAQFNQHIAADDRVREVTLPIGGGMTLICRQGGIRP